MAVPEFQAFHLPVLKWFNDGEVHGLSEAAEAMGAHFQLADEDREQLLPSGRETTLRNRVSWALTDLRKAGLIIRERRGHYKITPSGKEVLTNPPARIDRQYLMRFEPFKEWQIISKSPSKESKGEIDAEAELTTNASEEQTPDEIMEQAHSTLRDNLLQELLDTIKQMDALKFEQLVVDLMLKMGYGGSLKDRGRLTKATGDGGIDGLINEDKLGLDVIYLQAKRYTDNVVGRPQIQEFVGALAGQQANKGVFITTSSFTKNAEEYARAVQQKVILIDGERLADLMIEHNLGVSVQRSYEVKRIDSDYFEVDV